MSLHIRYYLQNKCVDPKNFDLKQESLTFLVKNKIFEVSEAKIEIHLKGTYLVIGESGKVEIEIISLKLQGNE